MTQQTAQNIKHTGEVAIGLGGSGASWMLMEYDRIASTFAAIATGIYMLVLIVREIRKMIK